VSYILCPLMVENPTVDCKIVWLKLLAPLGHCLQAFRRVVSIGSFAAPGY
jgi:hypothetical protein